MLPIRFKFSFKLSSWEALNLKIHAMLVYTSPKLMCSVLQTFHLGGFRFDRLCHMDFASFQHSSAVYCSTDGVYQTEPILLLPLVVFDNVICGIWQKMGGIFIILGMSCKNSSNSSKFRQYQTYYWPVKTMYATKNCVPLHTGKYELILPTNEDLFLHSSNHFGVTIWIPRDNPHRNFTVLRTFYQ